jgi:hypothetical protein
MRTMHYLNAKHSIDAVAPFYMERAPSQRLAVSVDGLVAAMGALDGMENVLSNECFDHPDRLTQDGITAYALALLQLRECASEAGFVRLTNACDALAVTVSRLIEDKNCASLDKCEALTRFIAHAWAMIQMYVDSNTAARHPMPIAASRN